MKLEDFPDVQGLTAIDKLQLVDKLWLSLGSQLEKLEVTETEKRLLDSRWEAYVRDPDSALTTDQFKAKVDALLK